MNNGTYFGRMTADPVLKDAGSSKLCSFTLASDIGFGDKKHAVFFRCVVWGKRAESINQYGEKGMQCIVTGELDYKSYTDKEGVEKFYNEINANDVKLIFPPKNTQPSGIPEDNPFSDDDIPF